MAIKAGTHVSIDDSAFLAHLKDYAAVMGKTMAEVIREQAGLFCVDMIGFTRPFTSAGNGQTADSKKKGMENVSAAVYKVFQPVSNGTTQQIAAVGRLDVFKMWEKRNSALGVEGKTKKTRWKQFQARYGGGPPIEFIGAGDMSRIKSLHAANRQDGGFGSLTSRAAHSKVPQALVERDADLKAYIKMKQRDVGILKSAYFFAAQKIKSNAKTSAWAKNPLGAVNAIAMESNAGNTHPEFTVGNAKGKKATINSLIRSAINYRAFAMRSNMARELNKNKTSLWLATASGKTANTNQYFHH